VNLSDAHNHLLRACSRLGWVSATLLAACVTGGVLPASSSATRSCENEQSRVETHSTQLPDCRAYEQVTPVYKEGYELSTEGRLSVSADGSHLLAFSFGTFAGSEDSSHVGTAYGLARTGSGWTATALTPPASQFAMCSGPFSFLASADFASMLFRAHLGASQPFFAQDFYRRNSDGAFTLVGPALPSSATAGPPSGQCSGESQVPDESGTFSTLGDSRDLSRVLFAMSAEEGANVLWPGDTTHAFDRSLYEYVGTGNAAPLLVGVTGPEGSTSLVGQCGTYWGSTFSEDAYNAISADGSKVFFTPAGEDTEPCGGTQPPVNELFARIDQSQTVAISEPTTGPSGDCSTCLIGAPADATFQGASEDGSRAFFTTGQELLPGDTGNNLYEYDFNAADEHEKVSLVSGGPEAAAVQGVARVSEDGSHVYFVATGKLTSEPNGVGRVAIPGEDNLYAYDTSTHQMAFVATLSPSDSQDWSTFDERPVEATPDGRFLLFASNADLTSDDTSSARQLFRYDAQTGDLLRVSIGQGGFNANGNTSSDAATFPVQNFVEPTEPRPLAISEDGAYVFFDSSDGLTPQALNDAALPGGHLANNVYEYHEGNVYLISDGQDLSRERSGNSGVELLGTDASGSNVLFTSFDQLVPQDTDTERDIYDARIDGGFPVPVSPAGCAGEACQGAPSAAPSLLSSGSVSQVGTGNLTPAASGPTVIVKPKPLTRAQKLAKALKACRQKPRKRRATCVKQAKKRYGDKRGKADRGRRASRRTRG
jgi:hypothetical protein